MYKLGFIRILFGLGIIYLGFSIFGKSANEIFGYYSFLDIIEKVLKGLVNIFGGVWSSIILFLIGGIFIFFGLKNISKKKV